MQSKNDEQIKHQVGSELKWDTRTWNLDIQVDVSDGVVTLTGVIPSYAQKVAAQDAAHRVQGVLDVANDTIVKMPTSAATRKLPIRYEKFSNGMY